MAEINKILYIVLAILLGGLGIHKFLTGRIVPGIVHILLSFAFGIGWIIAVVEAIFVAVKFPANADGNITLSDKFFDFL